MEEISICTKHKTLRVPATCKLKPHHKGCSPQVVQKNSPFTEKKLKLRENKFSFLLNKLHYFHSKGKDSHFKFCAI